MALTQEELLNLQRFAPITRPTSPYSSINNPPQQARTLLSNTQAATGSSNPYASLMALTPQQRTATSTGGFDPAIYKKLSGLLTTPATGTGAVGGDGSGVGPGSGAGTDSAGAGSGAGSGGGLGVGSGQGLSSDLQNTALSLISLGSIYPGFLPGGIVAKLIGLLGGVTADSQLSKLSDAQKALDAIDKQNAAALESGSSRTFDPYSGTKGVLSVSDADGNVRAFDPYAGDSAKDADKSKALGDSALSTAISNQISNDKSGLLGVDTATATGLAPSALGGVSSLALDNLGDRPQTNPTTSLPTLGYTGTTLGLLGDFIAGSSTSLNPASVETREAKPNPYAGDFVGPMPQNDPYAFVGPMPQNDPYAFVGPMPKSDTYTGNLVEPMPGMPVSYTPTFAQPTPTPERPKSDTYTGAFVGPMPQNNTLSGGLLGDFAARQDEADAAVIASDYAARENDLFSAARAGVTPLGAAPSVVSTTFQGSAYSPAVAAAADKAAADKAAADLLGLGLISSGGDVVGLGAPGVVGGDLGQFLAKGGMVNMKPQMNNPPGPDDGYAALQNGEYVIRKKAVQKYGPNIFEQINAGRIPARRLKSLLE